MAAASHEAGDLAILARVDLLLAEDGTWRACEVNADCPGGYNEALGLPRLACAAGFTGGVDPTHVTDVLARRLEALAEGRTVGLLYATAYAEDLQVCALVQRLLATRGVRSVLVPPTAPRLERGELVAGGERLGALYRFFPTEYMEGQRNVADVVEATRTGAIRSLTSFAHVYAQSKLAFALRLDPRAVCSDEASRASLAAFVPRIAERATADLARGPRGRLGWGGF